MKKRLLTLLTIIMVFAIGMAPMSFVATAGTASMNGMEDNFDGSSLDNTKWTLTNNDGGDIGQYVMPGTLKMIKMPAGSSLITTEKVGKAGQGTIVEFDLLDYGNGGVVRILKGMDAKIPSPEDLNDAFVQNTDARSARGDWKAFANYRYPVDGQWVPASVWHSVGFSKLGSRYQFNFNSDGSFVLKTKTIGEDDSKYIDQIKTEATDVETQWVNAKFKKPSAGYAGIFFESANASLVLDNVKITSQDNTSTLEDDFEYFNIDTAKWTPSSDSGIIAGFGKSLRINNIKTDGKGKDTTAQVITNAKIVDLGTSNDVSTEINFTLRINSLKAGSMGMVFGLDNTTAFTASEKFMVKFGDNANKLSVGFAKGGKELLTAKNSIALSSFADFVPVKIIIKNNGTTQNLSVYIKGALVNTISLQKLVGNIAFIANVGSYEEIITPAVPDDPETPDVDETVPEVKETRKGLINVEIDDFKVKSDKYIISTAKNLVNKFDSNVLGDDWHLTSIGLGGLGGEGKDPLPAGEGVNIVDGKLVFNKASDGSYFGANAKYSNFDLTFDISDIAYEDVFDADDNPIKSKSQFFGITFGRDELDTQYHGGNGFANTLFFDYNPWGGTDNTAPGAELGRLYLTQGNAGNITDIVYNFANPWSKANQERGGITVRVKVIDGNLSVYLRYADEPTSRLEEPILTQKVENRIGYVSLCCTEPTFYSIDNFAISNIDQTGVVVEPVKPCPNPEDHEHVCPKPEDHDHVCPKPEDHDHVCPDPSAHEPKPAETGCGKTKSATLGGMLAVSITTLGALLIIKKH